MTDARALERAGAVRVWGWPTRPDGPAIACSTWVPGDLGFWWMDDPPVEAWLVFVPHTPPEGA